MITLVLLPGMDGTGTLFEPFVAALGSEFTVKVVRYPTTEPMRYAELEAFTRAALPGNEPFVILGESFSGPIAVSLAASCPSQVKGLILCCTFVRNPRPAFSSLGPLARVLPLAVAPAGILSFMLLGAFSTAALRSALARAVAQVSPSVLRARLQAVLSVNVSAKLAALKVPVLYLRASHDRVVPSSASELVSQSYPNVKVVQVEGPHCLLQAAASESAQVIRGFLREVQNAV
jgi:pimeloyl-ACP methyl ester carboxylesterase